MNAKPRVAFLSSRIDWISLQILILFVSTIIYAVIIWQNESTNGQVALDRFRATVAAVVPFSHFALVCVLGMFELGGLIMLFFFHKMEEAAKQGLQQGLEQGRAEVYSKWHADWERRRQEAAEKGIPFNEPPPPYPYPSNGGSESS